MNYKLISSYLDYCLTHKRLSKHTIRAYKNDLDQFYISNQNDIETYIKVLTTLKIKTSTLKRKIACLKSFYNYLKSKNIINENPFNTLKFSFTSEKILPKTIPYDELKCIYIYLTNKIENSKSSYQIQKSKRNLLIISLLLSTGIRISELCNIKIKNINISTRTLHIMGKGKKERILFLGDDTTFTLLNNYISEYCKKSSSYLFSGKIPKKSLSTQSVRLILKNIRKNANISTYITPHMFRHSFATMLLDSNVDIRYIQHILGHSSISVTQIYTHVSQNKQREILSLYNPITSIID